MNHRLQLIVGPLLVSIGLTGLMRSLMVEPSVVMLLYFALMVVGSLLLHQAVLRDPL